MYPPPPPPPPPPPSASSSSKTVASSSTPTIATVRRLAAASDSRYPRPNSLRRVSGAAFTAANAAASAAAVAATASAVTSAAVNEKVSVSMHMSSPPSISPQHTRQFSGKDRNRGVPGMSLRTGPGPGPGPGSGNVDVAVAVASPSVSASSNSSNTVTPFSPTSARNAASSPDTSINTAITTATSASSMQSSTVAAAMKNVAETKRVSAASSTTSNSTSTSTSNSNSTSSASASMATASQKSSLTQSQSHYTSAMSREGTPSAIVTAAKDIAPGVTTTGSPDRTRGHGRDSIDEDGRGNGSGSGDTYDSASPTASAAINSSTGAKSAVSASTSGFGSNSGSAGLESASGNESARHSVTTSSGSASSRPLNMGSRNPFSSGPGTSKRANASTYGSSSSGSGRGSSDSGTTATSSSKTTGTLSIDAVLGDYRAWNRDLGVHESADETATAVAGDGHASPMNLPEGRTSNNDNHGRETRRNIRQQPQQQQQQQPQQPGQGPTKRMSVFELARLRLTNGISASFSSTTPAGPASTSIPPDSKADTSPQHIHAQRPPSSPPPPGISPNRSTHLSSTSSTTSLNHNRTSPSHIPTRLTQWLTDNFTSSHNPASTAASPVLSPGGLTPSRSSTPTAVNGAGNASVTSASKASNAGAASPSGASGASPVVERSNPMGPEKAHAQTVSSRDPKAVAAAATDMKNIVRRKITGYVGFANLPNQWHRKSVRKGFSFNVMVVGESGLGKSTLVNTLFNSSLYPPKEYSGPSNDILPKTVGIQSTSSDIEENGVRLRLTVVDTPGFGDFVNNDESWRPIVENIESRFDAYLEAENKVNRMNIVDNRIHACIYFIQPTGHSLKPLDIQVMKLLHTKVNLIPVIAKSDTLTDEEVGNFKQRILADINYHRINIFESPRYELDDEETIAENQEIMSKVPFAVVGANTEVTTADGRKVRGRRYPWGVIEVDNEEHCDFVKLRQMLIRTHMEELKEQTNNVLYEDYRTEKLTQMGVTQDSSVFKEVNPAVKQEEERALHEAKLAKMESEMKAVFQQKVHEKESKLKQSEDELYARHREMKEQLEKQRAELEEKKARIESGRPVVEEKYKRGKFSLR